MDRLKMACRTGPPGQAEDAFQTGLPGQDRQGRTSRTGLPEQDRKDRTVRTGLEFRTVRIGLAVSSILPPLSLALVLL